MPLFKKENKPEVVVAPVPTEVEEIGADELKTLKELILSREEVKIYFAQKEGERLYNLFLKLDKQK